MNEPVCINEQGFQDAWMAAVRYLSKSGWNLWDVIVRIDSVDYFDEGIHRAVTDFAKSENLLTPRQVGYTIFPYGLAEHNSFNELCRKYIERYYPRLRKKPKAGWGTYFHRMIAYPTIDTSGAPCAVNQLSKIRKALQRDRVNGIAKKAAYTMAIIRPGGENARPRGGPCLNSIAFRVEKSSTGGTLTMLAVYRNHDFRERAYGNYYGLCKLLRYMAEETGYTPGCLTCVSSHAFVDNGQRALSNLVNRLE